MLISFVSPVYRCRNCLEKLVSEINDVCRETDLSYEILLVDDGCPENSWAAINELCAQYPKVKGVKLARNFGQHSAIEAGLKFVEGEWIVILDCDLQDQPSAFRKMWREAQTGADIVLVRRQSRTDAWHRRVLSSLFYKALSSLTGTKLSAEIANFGIYRRKVIDAYNSWSEEQKFFPVMIQWLGFDQRTITVPHAERFSGTSSYNFRSLLSLGVRVVLSFSDRPLWFVSMFGMFVACVAFLASIAFLVQALSGNASVQGWPSLILSIWFLGGFNIAAVGVAGIYLGRTLREAKGRPSYVVSESLNIAGANV